MNNAAKKVTTGMDASLRLFSGMEFLARTVRVTLGPGGRQVVLQHRAGLAPRISKDGVGVARELIAADHETEMGLRLLREAAIAVSEEVGDGTTTAIVLAHALATRCLTAVISGAQPAAVRTGMALAAVQAMHRLSGMTATANRTALENVARTAANGDARIGALLGDAFDAIGLDGVIEVEAGNSREDILEVKLGATWETMSLIRELLPPVGALQLKRPLILLYDRRIDTLEELLPALELAISAKRPLLVMADDIGEAARLGLITNQRKGVVQTAVIKPPMHGDTRLDVLMDLAILCGGHALLERDLSSLANLRRDDLGGADHVTITPTSITLGGTHGDKAAIRRQIAILRGDLTTGDPDTDSPSGRNDYLEKRSERLKLLLGATAILHVGGSTDAEIKARLPLVENARRALLSAAESGIVPGGGAALLRVAATPSDTTQFDDDTRLGGQILRESLEEPARWIARNAGYNPDEVVARTLASSDVWHGFDAARGDYANLHEAGITDSLRVVQHTVRVAVSIAGSLLTTGSLISRIEEKQKPELAHGTQAVHNKLLTEGAFDS